MKGLTFFLFFACLSFVVDFTSGAAVFMRTGGSLGWGRAGSVSPSLSQNKVSSSTWSHNNYLRPGGGDDGEEDDSDYEDDENETSSPTTDWYSMLFRLA